MKPAQLLVAVLVAAAALVAVFFYGTGGSPDATNGRTPPAPAVRPDDSLTLDGAATAQDEPALGVPGDTANRAAVVDRPDAAPAQVEEEILVRGRVLFPAAAPADPALQVFALTQPCRYSDFASSLDHPGEAGAEDELPEIGRLREQIRAARIASAPVTPVDGADGVDGEGRFELRLPARPRSAFLMLRGRYLFLHRAVEVTLAPDPGPVVLAPDAGAWVHGTVSGPDGADPGAGRVRLFGATSGGPMGFGGQPDTFTGLVPVEGGRFEVRAVPATEPYTWTVYSPLYAGQRQELGSFEPGQEVALQAVLAAGASVRGVVVDGGGQPTPAAVVSGWLPGRAFGLDDERVRKVEADERGAYALTGLPAGRVKVSADHPERLDSTKRSLTLQDGEELQGVDLVLEDGRTVGGRVTLEGGAPAAGVDVRAWFDFARVSGPEFFNSTRGARARTRTDAEGRFELRGLGAGPFVVEATDERPLPGGGEEARWRDSRDHVLASGAEVLLVLRPPIALHGRVVDDEGEPVEGFSVVARREVMGEFASSTVDYRRGGFADPGGEFLLEGLEAGVWTVAVEGEGLVSPAPLEVALPQGGEPLELTVVRSASVTGKVVDPDGGPVANARVKVDPGNLGWQIEIDPYPDAPTARSQPDGGFELPGLTPGTVALVAEAAGFAESNALSLELEPGQLFEDVRLMVTRGGTITGEVYTKEGGRGAGWFVMGFRASDWQQVMSGADGRGTFLIENVPAGSWMLMAMDPGAEMEVGEEGIDMSAMMSAWSMTQANVEEGGEVHVVIGAPPEDPVRVSGTVTLGGEPYKGAMVSFVPPGERMYEAMKNTSVAADGSYSLELDGPGSYVVSIQSSLSGAGQQNSIEYGVDVPERPDFEHDFELPEGRVSGRVLGPDGGPAGGTRITLTPDGEARTDSFFGGQYTEIVTEADGTFDIRALRAGTYRLSAGGASPFSGALQAPYGRVTSGDLALGEDQWLRDVELRLPEPGVLDVTVVDAAGNPLPQATVFVRDEHGRMLEPFSMVVTDGAGHCAYEGVAPGEVTVSARIANLTCAESEVVRVPEGGRVAVTLHLEQGTILWIRVRDADGDPTAAELSVTDETGREMTGMFGMQDLQALYMEGQFSPHEHRLGPLPPGRYEVTATVGGETEDKKVTLRGEAEKRLTLRIR